MSEPQQTLTIQQALDVAVEHHTAGRLAQAENIYQQIVQNDPNQPVALHFLGVIAHQQGKSDTAVDLITRALAIKPDYVKAHSNLGMALQGIGRLEEAVASYHRALDLEPGLAETHYNLGNALTDIGNLEGAVVSYGKAIGLKPDYPEAYNNLGNALRDSGKLEESLVSYHKALALTPDYAVAHNNLGIALHYLGRLEEAVTSYRKALALKPDYPEAYNNLGITLQEVGELDRAVISFGKALAIKPDFADVHNNLGNALNDLGKLDEALKSFEFVDTPACRARVLECLFALGRYDTFYEKQNKSKGIYAKNIRAAAISAFASHQLNRRDPHPFCPTPLDFVQVHKNLDVVDVTDGFLRDLVAELKSREAVWEPPGKATKNGFQTMPDLFAKPTGLFADLDQIIKNRIENYRLRFCSKDCVFIRLLPKTISLSGWFVRLLKGGYQTEHMHSGGWLSGVFYLQVPNFSNQEEGSIELGLWGYNYPILNKSYPKKRFYPKSGDIILFPSSLFHRTIPFHSNEERMCIAFDVIPT